jgi:hypothetical protein
LIFSSVVLVDLLYHDVVTDEFVLQDFSFVANKQGETWERVTQIRDKFEYDRERRIRERGKNNACWCSAGYLLHALSCNKITTHKLSDIRHSNYCHLQHQLNGCIVLAINISCLMGCRDSRMNAILSYIIICCQNVQLQIVLHMKFQVLLPLYVVCNNIHIFPFSPSMMQHLLP